MSEYTDEILKRAGLEKGSKSTIIDSKKLPKKLKFADEYNPDVDPEKYPDAYTPTEKGWKQVEKLGNPELLFTETGIYAVAGSSKKEQDEREKVLAELAMNPEKVADLTNEERNFLESRGYVRNEDKRLPYLKGIDSIASMFMEGKEPSSKITGTKATYKKTR